MAKQPPQKSGVQMASGKLSHDSTWQGSTKQETYPSSQASQSEMTSLVAGSTNIALQPSQ